jgi:hypothetical protein
MFLALVCCVRPSNIPTDAESARTVKPQTRVVEIRPGPKMSSIAAKPTMWLDPFAYDPFLYHGFAEGTDPGLRERT